MAALTQAMINVGERLNWGIGPALEARDVLSVLRREKRAPRDLRDRALLLAGRVLEMSSEVPCGEGKALAQTILDDGRAWQKFQTSRFQPPGSGGVRQASDERQNSAGRSAKE